ncbi:protein-glutamate O-methyltransferase CheR [Chitinophaga pendula]|uniref:CheR family methyltransferase n=1 Tax=Chitinophaga TaxID=79328 RepID=UPI000BB066C5|nr:MULTISPECIES: protein-glutamate O-methyltransferase CheR [Chitinophaga]ASZ12536.1 chemotaxis protein CheR [Chitinophaga sp. MD30]UCJ09860.1 protein-glutamate O-methyltransferase CheR [Chitinophaga pendula]
MVQEIHPHDFSELLQIVQQQYGYDFTGYSPFSLKRRIIRFMAYCNARSLAELRYRLLYESGFFLEMLQFITVNVTEMFRDPSFYRQLREQIIPRLASYPIIKIWHAGCATGEEVYSMAILLEEAGLLDRCRIYATDLNEANLIKAESGCMPLKVMKEYTQNYIQAGGIEDFSNYYSVKHQQAILDPWLLRNIIFFQHNLVTDQVFNEFQLICCRNVFIYFNKELQDHVVKLFYDSLASLGYLALGIKESMLYNKERTNFETISSANKIFRRKS